MRSISIDPDGTIRAQGPEIVEEGISLAPRGMSEEPNLPDVLNNLPEEAEIPEVVLDCLEWSNLDDDDQAESAIQSWMNDNEMSGWGVKVISRDPPQIYVTSDPNPPANWWLGA